MLLVGAQHRKAGQLQQKPGVKIMCVGGELFKGMLCVQTPEALQTLFTTDENFIGRDVEIKLFALEKNKQDWRKLFEQMQNHFSLEVECTAGFESVAAEIRLLQTQQ